MVTRMQEGISLGALVAQNCRVGIYTKSPRANPQFKGLTLVLDAHTDVVSAGTVKRSFLIQPGHVTYAAISATGIIASDAIQSVSPVTRNCYFPNEFELQVHSNYSRANCLLECSMDYAPKQAGREVYPVVRDSN
ncbi:hypothetical protein TCAL_17087 [Tigriopus californicus]|uniref:Uncharacterized protein n=1 Tax=Tigriopus californicus TaxID=6832 RepID=A0A553PP94_TIGCA|nr:hypothetical protein TCAL_17087 [Tigriopus californicus]